MSSAENPENRAPTWVMWAVADCRASASLYPEHIQAIADSVWRAMLERLTPEVNDCALCSGIDSSTEACSACGRNEVWFA